jgi:glycosyltransferase involved in cell wall biosynthesis
MARGESEERWRWFLGNSEVTKVFAEVTRLPDPPPAAWWDRQHHRLRVASHLSTLYRNPEYHRRLREVIAEEIAKRRADLVYVDGLAMTQYFDGRDRVSMAVDLHDCSTLLCERTARRERHWRRRLALSLETRSIARWEQSLAERFGVIITNSTVDEAALRRLAPRGRIVTIPNGVDSEYFASTQNGHGSRRMVFTGVMNYGPNADAAQYCADEIFPWVRAKVPDAEFWVVGADPSAEVRRLSGRNGIHVTGEVADIRPHIQAAGVCVCPMRYGAGMKNKILAAMAMGKPVVSTSVGLEGIEVRPGHDVLRADTPREFADEVASVLTTESLARRLGESGYRLVKERYSWTARAESLERTLRTVSARRGC